MTKSSIPPAILPPPFIQYLNKSHLIFALVASPPNYLVPFSVQYVVLITSVCTSFSASTMFSVFQHNTWSTVIQMSSHKLFRFVSIVYRVDGHTDKLPQCFFVFQQTWSTVIQMTKPVYRLTGTVNLPSQLPTIDLDIALSRGRALQPRPRRCETLRCELPYGNKHHACETHAYTRLFARMETT